MVIRPSNLRPGDIVAVVAPARSIAQSELDSAVEAMSSWGLQVRLGANTAAQYHQFAGTDQQRLSDFQEAIDDKEVRAIFCARGGYGTTRIISELNLETLVAHPKWIVGFSDVTALHCVLHQMQLESVHGLMPIFFNRKEYRSSLESLRDLLFGKQYEVESAGHQLNRFGSGSGQVIGGNLTMLIDSFGTEAEIETAGKILFVEEVDEYLYHLDRMMVHLKRAGKLSDLSGLVVGRMSQMKDNDQSFGKSPFEIVHTHIADYSYPVCFDFPIGHEPANLAIPCTRSAELTVGEFGSRLSFT